MINWCDFRTSAEIEENQERRGVPTMSHWSGTPTQGSQHCSMFLQKRMCMQQINYLQRLIRLQEEFF